jgi:glycerol-3-phosphate O-acyltransferase
MTGVLDSKSFESELIRIASAAGRPLAEVQAEAERDLQEMYCRRAPLAVRGFAALSRLILRRGYHRQPVYDKEEVAAIRSESEKRSIVYLVTHKTYLDFFVLFDFLHRHGLATPYIFGGINMNFAGFGGLARRAGGIFIRRSFRGDPGYKAVLQQYIQSLVCEGATFMWAIEGTRSRTGKLLIPRMGLLNYVVNVSRSLGDDAVSFVPVSVVYDQIPDVVDMAAQEAGAVKKPESLSWFMHYLRGLGGPFGYIYIRFGDTITLSDTPDAPDLEPVEGLVTAQQVELQKLAFEVCYRINEVTPATMTSLVLMVLLCRGRTGIGGIRLDVALLGDYIVQTDRRVVMQRPSRAPGMDPAESIDALLANGVIQKAGSMLEINPGRISEAVYYSNMAVHHFVTRAFAELILVGCTEGREDGTIADAAWRRALKLRDLFKFEFFFSRSGPFREQVMNELGELDPAWERVVAQGGEAVDALLGRKDLLVAAGVLSPFVAAYQYVAQSLADDPVSANQPQETLIQRCLETSQAAASQPGRSRPPVSRELLRNGIRLAQNRGLLSGARADVIAEREALVGELELLEAALNRLRRIVRHG